MKKLLTILLVVVLAVACVGLVACAPNGIEGTYKFYSVEYNGTTYVVGTSEAIQMGFTTNSIFLEVRKDGTATITNTVIDESYTGTWVLEGNSFIMTYDGDSQTFTVSGNTIIINGDGEVVTLKKA